MISLRASLVTLGLAATLLPPMASAAPPPPAAAGPASSPAPTSAVRLRRFALFIGVNDGGPGRQRLRYAVSDARSISRVLDRMGGIAAGDAVFLADPNRAALLDAFDRVRELLRAGATPGVRRELLVYYSGHSDEEGLLIQGDRVSYDDLRARLKTLPVEVRVAILDSCSSGAFTRRKGGVHHAPFLVDASVDMRGQAILTSSSANEVAQESDRIGGSFFTHFLVSGLRGAADVNGDRRVTLQEAFQFASQETLARTERTRGGPQHAAYEFDLAGTGELVVTDVRTTQAALLLAPELSGRISVRDGSGDLVAELRKSPGHPVELGLEPGPYVVTMDGPRVLFEAKTELVAGQRAELARLAFHPAGPLEVAVARGDGPGPVAPAAGGVAAPGATAATATAAPAPMQHTAIHFAMATMDPQPIDVGGLALSVVADRVARVRGLQLSFGVVQTDEQMSGLQLAMGAAMARGYTSGIQLGAFASLASGTFRGAQLSTFVASTRGDARGLQLAAITSVAAGSFTGLQLSTVNVAEQLRGLQVGAVDVARQVRGAQLSAINVAQDVAGLQLSAVNVAGQARGFQLAAVNVAGEMKGFQLGAVNVARRAKGFQLGAINIVDEHDGEAFGVITIAKNGIHNATIYTTDTMAANFALKLGTRHLYSALTASFNPGDQLATSTTDFTRSSRRFGFGLAVGWRFHLDMGRLEALEVEAYSMDVRTKFSADGDGPRLSSLRLLATVRLAPHIAIVAGPTVNASVAWGDRDIDLAAGPSFLERIDRSGGTTVRIYPGFLLGLQI
jgi:hypothetical protein